MNHPQKTQAWKTVSLGALAEFRNGVNFTKSSFGRGIKVINVKDFQDRFKPSFEELGEINPKGVVRENDLLREGDIVFVRSNGNRQLIGRSLLIKGASVPITHSAFTIRARFQSPEAFPLFYAYALRSYIVRDALSAFGGGTNINNLNQGILSNLQVPLPPLSIQRRIAEILSAYDELIENNTRRIKNLEEMARALYREWFVNFRFPGHETVKYVDSPLGKIPASWEVRKVTEAIYVGPRTQVPKETEKPHVPMDSLSTNSMLIDPVNMRTGNSGSKFKNGDTLFARITPCLENGKTAFVQFLPTDSDVAIGSTEFIVLRSRTLCPEYVYLMARSNEFRDNAIKSMSGATGRQRVQEKCFDKFLIAQPDEDTLRAFLERTGQMFRLIHNLAQKNTKLRLTRDLLLRNLISGSTIC